MLKEFILQYMSEPALRMRIRRGLLKVEQMHALARDLLGFWCRQPMALAMLGYGASEK